jgi:hypothetical protein
MDGEKQPSCFSGIFASFWTVWGVLCVLLWFCVYVLGDVKFKVVVTKEGVGFMVLLVLLMRICRYKFLGKLG